MFSYMISNQIKLNLILIKMSTCNKNKKTKNTTMSEQFQSPIEKS